MKVAVLCLCFISITAAWPVSKSKHHAISASSEEKYDARGHHSHRYRHHHVNSQSWESLEHPQNDLASPQQTLYSSEESVDLPVKPHFPDVSSKSHEDVDDDDDDEDNDSNDTDESDEVVTSFPTEIPVTVPFPPFTRGDNAGRGDSVGYRVRAVKSSKLRKAAKKLIAYDATEEDESVPDADSQQAGLSQEDSATRHSLGKHSVSREWADKSHGQDSSELDSKRCDQSVENESWQKFDSREAEADSKASVRGDSHQSVESRERQQSVESRESHQSVESRESRVSAESPDDNSNQTLESAEDAHDRHSIENNEVTL
ncbi:osteopontin isoform X2 [Falco naumanni]|uniref:osteopontin isoform X2 n=1 Tax=Falco naumanni TaxID=148594 RepID=UPI001ADE7376|nr:osteopontin isoform X2 [Falco naumanni]